MLQQALAEYGSDWKKVSEIVGRKPEECKSKSNRLGVFGNKTKIECKTKKEWDYLDCKKLKTAIEQNGQSWVHVAAYMGHEITEKQCQEKAQHLGLIDGGGKDSWSEKDLKNFREAWENSKIEDFKAKCKRVSQVIGKSSRQCLIQAVLLDLDTKLSQ